MTVPSATASRPSPRLGLLCLPAGLAALLLGLSLPRVFQMGGQDEVLHYVALGQRLFDHGYTRPDQLITFSPHLYGLAIWLAHLLCGPGLPAARFPGLVAWSLTFFLCWVWLAPRNRTRSAAPAGWALALLATTPLALQAAAIVDIDNTILVPAVLALCLAVHPFVEGPRLWPGVWVAALLALALWCRLTTPTVLLPVFLLFAWLRGGPRVAGRLAVAFAAGVALFLVTWWGYCHATGVDFSGPFEYLVASFAFCTVGEERGIGPGKVALTVLYTVFWLGPALACLCGLLGLERLQRLRRRREVEAGDLFLLAGGAILGGYGLVGGTLFGFPKYHCPALPLLLIALAGSFRTALHPIGRNGWLAALGVLLAGLALQVLVIGDPLLVLRLPLREAVYHGEGARGVLVAGVVVPLLLAVALGGGLLVLLCRLRLLALPCALASLALGMNAGMACLQLSSGYQTGYNYGDQGDAQAVTRLLAAHLPRGTTAIVPGEIVYLLDRPEVRSVPNEWWLDPEVLCRVLSARRVHAAAISLLTNTTAQVSLLVEVASALPAYQRLDVGRYVVFLRLPAPGPPVSPEPGDAPPSPSSAADVERSSPAAPAAENTSSSGQK